MNIQEKLKKAEEKVEKLKQQLSQQQAQEAYGRMAITSDEANFCAGTYGDLLDIDSFGYFHDGMMHGRTFTTKGAAERFLKAERLAFKCRKAMAESWGDEKADWTSIDQGKYYINFYKGNKIKICVTAVNYQQFAFKTMIDAQRFIENKSDEDIRLMLMRGDV